jgi:hypothetical protein
MLKRFKGKIKTNGVNTSLTISLNRTFLSIFNFVLVNISDENFIGIRELYIIINLRYISIFTFYINACSYFMVDKKELQTVKLLRTSLSL